MLDSDLATLYGAATKRLNEQVRRNLERFPEDFAFQLSLAEVEILRSQFAASRWGGRRYRPWVFTEHGAVMLASVLSTPVAIQASLSVVRSFIRLRAMLGTHEVLTRRLDELEQRYEGRFKVVFQAIRELMGDGRDVPRQRIGFHPQREKKP